MAANATGEVPASSARGRRIALALVGTLLVLLLAMWFIAPIATSHLLVDAIEARLGGQARLSVSTALSGPRPGVEIQGFDWRPAAPVDGALTVDSIRLDTDWLSSDGVRPVALHLRDAQVELRETPDGQWALPRMAGGAADDGTAIGGFALTQVSLVNVRVRLVPQAGVPAELTIDTADLVPDGTGWRLRLKGGMVHALGQWSGPLEALLEPISGGLKIGTLSVAGEGRLAAVAISGLQVTAQDMTLGNTGFDLGGATLGMAMEALPGLTGGARVHARISALHGDGQRVQAMVDALELAHEGQMPVSVAMRTMHWTKSGDVVHIEPLLGTAKLSRPEAGIDLEVTAGALDYAFAAGQLSLSGLSLRAQLPDPKAPGRTVMARVELSGHGVPVDGRAAGEARIVAETSTVAAQWSVDRALDPPLRLSARVDRLDLDRWLPAAGNAREPAPLSVWRDWPVSGDLVVDRLTWQGITFDKARLTLGRSESP